MRDITSSYTEGDSRAGSYTVGGGGGGGDGYGEVESPQRWVGGGGGGGTGAGVGVVNPSLPPNGHPPLIHTHFPPSTTITTTSAAPTASKKAKKQRKDEIHFADLRFGEKIGEGSFGEVFRGTLWGQEVAIKKLRIKGLDAGGSSAGISREFRKEVKIMRTLRHPNIVEFLGVCMEPPNLCLVTEFLSNGSLEDVLERMTQREGKKFSLKRCISLAKDIARGLNWLHHKGIIHRDLKSANILLDQNGKAKICEYPPLHTAHGTCTPHALNHPRPLLYAHLTPSLSLSSSSLCAASG